MNALLISAVLLGLTPALIGLCVTLDRRLRRREQRRFHSGPLRDQLQSMMTSPPVATAVAATAVAEPTPLPVTLVQPVALLSASDSVV